MWCPEQVVIKTDCDCRLIQVGVWVLRERCGRRLTRFVGLYQSSSRLSVQVLCEILMTLILLL